MPTTIKADEALLYRLYKAQLDEVKEFLLGESETTVKLQGEYQTITISRPKYRDRDYAFHDDSHDDLSSALELAEKLRSLYYENDLQGLEEWLNTPNEIADYNACDGICQALYELDCPALPKDIDWRTDEALKADVNQSQS